MSNSPFIKVLSGHEPKYGKRWIMLVFLLYPYFEVTAFLTSFISLPGVSFYTHPMYLCWHLHHFYAQWTANMDSENEAVHILPRKPPAERAVSLGWIITFHADDNGGMSALHRSSSLRLPTLLLNYLQNESYRLLQFPQRWPLSVICLTFCSPGDDGKRGWDVHNEHKRY